MKARVGVLLLAVRDFPRMLAFYRDVLGLPLIPVDPGAGYAPLRDFAQFRLEGDSVALELFAEPRSSSPPDYPMPRRNAVCVAFRVEDIHATVAELAARGVAFTKPVQGEDWGWYAPFRDPEGNRLQIYEARSGV